MSIFYSYPEFKNSHSFRNENLTGIITAHGKKCIPYDLTADKLDQMMKHGISLKDSATTTAALVNIPDTNISVFLKRNNNKGPRFTCRYLFRYARVFHAAEAADIFEKHNIKTPRVYMAAEKKKGLLLQSGYIITETVENVKSVHHLLFDSDEKEKIFSVFLPWAARTVATLHQAGIEHGDLKLINFYCDGDWNDPGNSFGIWDLDSVITGKKVSPEKVNREIARMFFPLWFIFDKQSNTLDYIRKNCREFCAMYHQFAPELYMPDTENILQRIEKRICKLVKKSANKAKRIA